MGNSNQTINCVLNLMKGWEYNVITCKGTNSWVKTLKGIIVIQ